jgi:hypothetical protein
MDQTLALGWMQAQARSRATAYRRVLGLNLVLYAALAIFAISAPAALAQLIGLPQAPVGWVRGWGGLLLALCALYLPGFRRPLGFRYANVIGIPIRLLLAILYLCLGSGFLWLAIFEAVFGIALAILYFNLAKAELMSRP